MIRMLQRILIPAFIFLLASTSAISQDITGIWRGYFITETGEQYKLEFQVSQNRSSLVTGVSYSYLDVRFYGKATMTGNFTRSNKEFKIQETRTVEVKSTTGGGTCIMNYKFSYVRSGQEEFLEGTYVGKSEDRLNPANNGKWGDCGGGKVFLRRVATSEFYVEPFLRDKPTTKRTIPQNKPAANTNGNTTKPVVTENKPIVKATPKQENKVVPPPQKEIVKEKQTTVKKIDEPVKTTPQKTVAAPVAIPPIMESRSNELVKTFTISSDEVLVKLYDNGVIDDDTISVYLDKQLVLSHKRLSTVPLTINIKMNDDQQEHELVMVAENLGRIPPNTSLMIVTAGDDRYQVHITSTDQKNAVVRFIYKKPK